MDLKSIGIMEHGEICLRNFDVGNITETLYDLLNKVLKYFWGLVKHSDLCCCVSKFYCSSSTNLEKCVEMCCGKCKEETSEHDTSCSSLEFDLDTDERVTTESESESCSNAEMNSSSCDNSNE